MSLDDAKAQLEALPGVWHVHLFIVRAELDSMPEDVQLCVRVGSPEILPEETRQGILRVQDTLERELGCFVSINVSAGLRMPDGG